MTRKTGASSQSSQLVAPIGPVPAAVVQGEIQTSAKTVCRRFARRLAAAAGTTSPVNEQTGRHPQRGSARAHPLEAAVVADPADLALPGPQVDPAPHLHGVVGLPADVVVVPVRVERDGQRPRRPVLTVVDVLVHHLPGRGGEAVAATGAGGGAGLRRQVAHGVRTPEPAPGDPQQHAEQTERHRHRAPAAATVVPSGPVSAISSPPDSRIRASTGFLLPRAGRHR